MSDKCPLDENRPETDCVNRHQCWEPCGELGKAEEHCVLVSPEIEKAIKDSLKE